MAKHRKLHILLFGLYCAMMLWLLFHRDGPVPGVEYWDQVAEHLNLTPFETIMRYVRLLDSSKPHLVRLAAINLFGNVIMFIPLGYLLPLVFSRLRKFRKILLTTTMIITLVEITQILTLVGYCDIDDLILNIIGSAMGYCLYRLPQTK